MRPKDRILDVFGLFAREHGGWIAVSDLIVLMAELGVDAQAVRSAASRMKRSDLLVAERVDGKAGYALSDRGLRILEDGDRRIFPASTRSDAESWVLILFSVPESERKKRYLIRSRLARLGFVQGPAASWIAPASLLEEARRMLERNGLDRYVTLFEGEFRALSGAPDVADAWDLQGIQMRYQEYLAVYRPIAESWIASPGTDRDAFVHHMNNIGDWRPLPYADPGLPATITPPGWLAEESRGVFATLNRQLRPGAQRFYRETVAGSAGVP
ncbi:MAG: PaaX family transcriptional regulator C-terminal domain-containing protein [Acidimicrobiales bacterium]